VSTGTLTTALKSSGFDPATRTLWILEGLTYYLSLDENRLLFGSMAALSAPGSMFAATMAPKSMVDRLLAEKKGGLMSFWKWGFSQDFGTVRDLPLLFAPHACCVLCMPASPTSGRGPCFANCVRF
jgi:Leucine carboxyl methyltransferase